MAEERDFECLRCGTCCRTILNTAGGVTWGIPLTEKEKNLFPGEKVSPRLAIGAEKPEIVLLWQLNVNICPHVNADSQCQIYTTRPLICQSFPIVAGAISNRCKVFSYRKPGVSYSEPFTMKMQLEASKELEAYLKKFLRKHRQRCPRLWEYNLTAEKWADAGKL